MSYNFALVIVCSILFYNFLLQTREHNDTIYQHTKLVPVTLSNLRNYRQLGDKVRLEKYITNSVETIYINVLKSASTNKHGYFHNLDNTQYRHSAISQIVEHIKLLFPGSSVSTTGDKTGIIVNWRNFSSTW